MRDNTISLLSSINGYVKVIADRTAPKNSMDRNVVREMSNTGLNVSRPTVKEERKTSTDSGNFSDFKHSDVTLKSIIDVLNALPPAFAGLKTIKSRDIETLKKCVSGVVDVVDSIAMKFKDNSEYIKTFNNFSNSVSAIAGIPLKVAGSSKVFIRAKIGVKVLESVMKDTVKAVSSISKVKIEEDVFAKVKNMSVILEKCTGVVESAAKAGRKSVGARIGLLLLIPFFSTLNFVLKFIATKSLTGAMVAIAAMGPLVVCLKSMTGLALLSAGMVLVYAGVGILIVKKWKEVLFGFGAVMTVMLLTTAVAGLSVKVAVLLGVASFSFVEIAKFAALSAGLVLGCAVVGIVARKMLPEIAYGFGCVVGVMLGLSLIGAIASKLGMFAAVEGKLAMMEVAKFAGLSLALVIGCALVGKIVTKHIDYVLYGFGAVMTTMLGLVGIGVLAKKTAIDTETSELPLMSIMKFAWMCAGFVLGCAAVGYVIKKKWDMVMYGFSSTAAVIGLSLGLAVMIGKSKNIADAEKGSLAMVSIGKFLLMCEGLVLGLVGISWLLTKFTKTVGAGTAVVAIAGTFAMIGGICMGAIGIAKLVSGKGSMTKANFDGIKRIILFMAMSEGLVLGVLGVSWLLTKFAKSVGAGTAVLAIVGTFGMITAIIMGAVGIAKLSSKFGASVKKGVLNLILVEGLIAGCLGIVYVTARVSKYIDKVGRKKVWGTLGMMEAILVSVGALALVASKLPKKDILIGTAVLGLCELLVAGAAGVVFLIAKAAKEVMKSKKGLLLTAELMTGVLVATAALAVAAGALSIGPVGVALIAGLAVMGSIEALIAGSAGVVLLMVKCKKSIDSVGGINSMTTFLKKDMKNFMSEIKPSNLMPGFTVADGAKLALRLNSLGGVALGMRKVSKLMSVVADIGRMVTPEGKIKPIKRIEKDGTIIYDETNLVDPVKTSEVICKTVKAFVDNTTFGFEDAKKMIIASNVYASIGKIVSPVSRFIDFVTGFQGVTLPGFTVDEKGTIKPSGRTFIRRVGMNKKGELVYGQWCDIEAISKTISRAVRTFVDNMSFGFTDALRAQRGMKLYKTIGEIVDPVKKFIDLLTGFEVGTIVGDDVRIGPGTYFMPSGIAIRKAWINKKGEVVYGHYCDVEKVSRTISNAVRTFVNSMSMGFEEARNASRGANIYKKLGEIVDPVVKYIDLVTGFEMGSDAESKGKIRRVTIDKDGNIVNGHWCDIAKVSRAINDSVSMFVDNMKMTYDEASAAATGGNVYASLNKIMDPLNTFVNLIVGFQADKDVEGRIRKVTVKDDGTVVKGEWVYVARVGDAFGRMLRLFTQSMGLKGYEKRRGKRGEKVYKELNDIIKPMSAFIDLATGFQVRGNYIQKMVVDKDGNVKTVGKYVNVIKNAQMLGRLIGTFVKTLYGKEYNDAIKIAKDNEIGPIIRKVDAAAALVGRMADAKWTGKLGLIDKARVGILKFNDVVFGLFKREAPLNYCDFSVDTENVVEKTRNISGFVSNLAKSQYLGKHLEIDNSINGILKFNDLVTNMFGNSSAMVSYMDNIYATNVNKVRKNIIYISDTVVGISSNSKLKNYESISNSIKGICFINGLITKVFGDNAPIRKIKGDYNGDIIGVMNLIERAVDTVEYVSNSSMTYSNVKMNSDSIAYAMNVIGNSVSAHEMTPGKLKRLSKSVKDASKTVKKLGNVATDKKRMKAIDGCIVRMNKAATSVSNFDKVLKKDSDKRIRILKKFADSLKDLSESVEDNEGSFKQLYRLFSAINDMNPSKVKEIMNEITNAASGKGGGTSEETIRNAVEGALGSMSLSGNVDTISIDKNRGMNDGYTINGIHISLS